MFLCYYFLLGAYSLLYSGEISNRRLLESHSPGGSTSKIFQQYWRSSTAKCKEML